MYSTITIEGFRCFPRFELHGLSRINLLVGANNSGKTALLEAIALLEGKGRPRSIVEAAFRRGEIVHAEEGPRADIRRVFRGHAVGMEVLVIIEGTTPTSMPPKRIELCVARQRKIRTVKKDEHGNPEKDEHGNSIVVEAIREDDDFLEAPRYLMRVYSSPAEDVLRSRVAGVDARGGLVWSADEDSEATNSTAQFVPTGSVSGAELVEMLAPLQLMDRWKLLLEALRIIDEQVEDFAISFQPSGRYHSRECVIVKLRGMAAPVPIGSLGDGVWRLFTLAVAMASAPGGVVLVDDVDTGLHYSVMEKMWKHIAKIAEHLDVQVFATTHSRDCYEALAAVEEGDATIHRIERGGTRSVIFHGAMVAAAAANDVEVR